MSDDLRHHDRPRGLLADLRGGLVSFLIEVGVVVALALVALAVAAVVTLLV